MKLDNGERLLCGVDLGGTKLAAALFRKDGSRVDRVSTNDHVCRENDEVIDVAAGLVRGLLDRNGLGLGDLEGVGIGIAGHVLFKKGMVITTSNFEKPFLKYPLVERLGRHLPGARIVLDNDANCQALGEWRFGAGRGTESMVFITVSTGVGAGIVLNGRLHRGHQGTAGEVGHSIIDFDSDQLCTCGNKGCSMAHSSGLFLPKLYGDKLKEGMTSCIDVDEGSLDTVCGELLAHGMKCNDEISIAVLNDSADAVGTSVFNVFQMLNPDLVVLGGGLMNLGEYYISRIRQRFVFLVRDMMYEEMEIRVSELGADAGLLGAAALLVEGM